MGKLKALIALVIIVGLTYVGWNMIPPYFHKYEFQDDLDDIARLNQYTHKTDDEVRAIVIDKARLLDIPLKEDQITITRTGDGLGISVHYRIHVEMAVHPVDLDFTANSMMKRI
ncbi:MAG TPA: hypothetical protein VKY85_11150 [Candidatus Angelobacter sp.]|nr:hypothetical protein [Candidatus Angelobacter sp.]